MPNAKQSRGPQFRTERAPLPPARPGRRRRPNVYRDQIEASLADPDDVVRTTEAGDADEARLIVKRLRNAAAAIGARVSTRTKPADDGGKIKVIFSATRKGPL